MTEVAGGPRPFSVHARDGDARHARLVVEESFEAAAAAYAEDFPALGDAHEISVIVREVDTGRQHCFRVDMDSGETAPCG